MRIGILALQGAFAEHAAMLERCGAEWFEIRQKSDLSQPMDGLILPGGESTVIGRLLRDLELMEPLTQRIQAGLPVFGTCAGLILLAKRMENDDAVYFGTMDMTVVRNAYGRQLGSFSGQHDFDGQSVPMVFIRAPYITEVGEHTEVLSVVDGNIVAARERNMLVTAFHPELTEDITVHRYFLNMVAVHERG